ncbi:MAG: hypothetical protein AAGH15_20495, partial [Myxococcota bacterium]
DGGIDISSAPVCVRHAVAACQTSNADIEGCERLYDRAEFALRCPELTRISLNCRSSGEPSYCVRDADCPESEAFGCVEESWFRFDLGAARTVSELRFIGGWWADRPRDYELWTTDDPTALPGEGATLVYEGRATMNPHVCIEGDPCTSDVPDGCCPNGRSQPQVVDQSAFTPACVLGDHPKIDAASFRATTGRYWFYVIKNGYFDDRIWLYEVELGDGCFG